MITQQTVVFGESILLGAALMLVYDVFRILRIAVKTPAALVAAEDLLFFILAAAATFLFMLGTVSGEVRFFILLGELIGGTLYYCTVGVQVMRVSKAIIHAAKAVLGFLYRMFIRPVLGLLGWILSKLSKPFQFGLVKVKIIAKKRADHLKQGRHLLYNLCRGKKESIGEEDGEAAK